MPEARPNPGKAAGAGALQGLHVLVVEDEYLLAQELCRDLVSEGATIMGPVPRLDAALDMLDRGRRWPSWMSACRGGWSGPWPMP